MDLTDNLTPTKNMENVTNPKPKNILSQPYENENNNNNYNDINNNNDKK